MKILQNTDSTTNYSLPNGQTGQLLCLLENFVSEQKEVAFYIKNQIKLLVSRIQEVEYSNNSTLSHFPFEINSKTGEMQYTKEFSWSRGDLSVLILLYKADKTLGENQNEFVANTVGNIVSKRTEIEPINQNPFIRNGTAGIAHCFCTLYNLSNKPFYKEAYEYWISETYRYKKLGFSESNHDDLLENYEGVNLILKTYETGGKGDWSRQILL